MRDETWEVQLATTEPFFYAIPIHNSYRIYFNILS